MTPRPHIRLLVALTLALISAPLAAFHEQGAAQCSGCHVMHESVDGIPVESGEPAGLIAESPSDVCLLCHAGDLGTTLGLDPLMPPPERGAGNFVFLYEDNINDAGAAPSIPILGEAAGHSIVAPGHGLMADSRHDFSPGGAFPAASLGCTSCHDPHGNASFRMLYGAVEVQGGLAVFGAPAPEAVGLPIDAQEAPGSHTAYLRGMSAWCGNCHGPYHAQGFVEAEGFEHPSDEILGVDERDWYNSYDGDGHETDGTIATAYLTAVPIEDPGASTASRAGARGTSRIMCLTCHRAHASSAPAAGRWDFSVALLADDGLASGSWPIPSPYPDPAQGTLCRKCHELGTGD